MNQFVIRSTHGFKVSFTITLNKSHKEMCQIPKLLYVISHEWICWSTDHFQYYDEFFTALHKLPTSWSQIPYQKSWLLYNISWQTSLPNDSACLGMLVINKHANQGYWELLEMAPSVTPRFIFAMDTLLYKPSCNSPLLISPLNWFF